MRRRSLLILALCAAAGAGPTAAAVRVVVPVSHAARMQIPGSAGSVIVGDPAVADALVINPHTIYVQGKANGQTEIVVLDRAGREVWQGEVAVISPGGGRVTVMRGPGQTTEMTCADVCTSVVAAPSAK